MPRCLSKRFLSALRCCQLSACAVIAVDVDICHWPRIALSRGCATILLLVLGNDGILQVGILYATSPGNCEQYMELG